MSYKILLIETDRPLAINFITYMKSYDYEVQWHVDPQKAISSIDEQIPDVIVQDVILAGHSGIELLYELRSYGDLQDLPVIIFSSISNREMVHSGLSLNQLNVTNYFYKPETSFGQLRKSIESILQTTHTKSATASV